MRQRVVIYGMNYAPEIAGVGRYTGEIGEYLAGLGHEVCVVTTPPHYPGWRILGTESSNRWSKTHVDGALVYRCPLYLHPQMQGVRRLIAPLSFALSSAPVALWRILVSRPDVVMVVEPTLFAAPVALFAAKLVGAKTVLHVQDLEIDAAFAVGHLVPGGVIARFASWCEKQILAKFDRVITIANAMAARITLKGVNPNRISVVRNWVDLAQIRPVADASAYRAELGLRPADFVVLYSGNIGAKQGVRLLVQAARQLSEHPTIAFVIAGEGPLRKELEDEAKRLPNLRVIDFQPTERFSEFLGIADVHVLPQEIGTADLLLPSKLGGMLASARRILATVDDGTELAHFLGDCCIMTPPGDATALAQAILTLKDAPYSEAQERERLNRARLLSKETVIVDFLHAMNFRTSDSPSTSVLQPI